MDEWIVCPACAGDGVTHCDDYDGRGEHLTREATCTRCGGAREVRRSSLTAEERAILEVD